MDAPLAPLAVIALCGALGGMARHFVSGFVACRGGDRFPWSTLVVNLTGAAAIGAFAAVLTGTEPGPPSLLWLALATGFLGSYTTVSAFSLQTLALFRAGDTHRAFAYVAASVAGTLVTAAGAWLGVSALVGR